MRRAFLALLLWGGGAWAQGVRGQTFNLQLFRPAVDSKGYVTVEASQILGHLDFSVGLVGTWARDPLTLSSSDGKRFNFENLITPQLQGALGLWKWVEVGVSLPVSISYGNRMPGDMTFGNQFIGDLGLHVKTRFLSSSKYPVGLGLLTSFYAPTATDHQFLGEGQFTFRPTLILDREWGRTRRFATALNLGAIVRPDVHRFTDDFTGKGRALGSQLTYGLALSFAVVPRRFDLLGELYGAADLTGQATGHPLEGILAAKVYMARNSYFEIGGGAGLLPANITPEGGMSGSPAWRLFLGFIFEPAIGDRDGDGIKDDVDKCPDAPEDFDGFEDEDGCPDPDNDKDGVLDVDDKCPNEPGPAENMGCPWPDRDHDGVLDKDDLCPDVPGPKENRGCPWPDRDHDGVIDKDDACPDDYGPKENHGCPWPDRDGDGIIDKDDRCPDIPGPRENQGCPKTITQRGGDTIVLQPIHFETAKATIKSDSFETLNDLANGLKANPHIRLLDIRGHADERGDDNYNLRLTDDRVAAVRVYLMERGVEPHRLVSHGYGEKQPLCRQHNEACWKKNRRVEFIILQKD